MYNKIPDSLKELRACRYTVREMTSGKKSLKEVQHEILNYVMLVEPRSVTCGTTKTTTGNATGKKQD